MASAISIHVPREGHDFVGDVDFTALNDISIHVPREGHDAVTTGDFARMAIISIHVPREGHDHCRVKRRMSRE